MTKIALIGDIHFGKFARSKEFCPEGFEIQDITAGAASLKRGLIKTLKMEEVDYLFVAGDLTSTGSPIEYLECFKLINEMAEEANILSDKIIISLGNHDVDWRITDIIKQFDKDVQRQVKELYQKISANVASLFIKENKFFEEGPAPFSGIISNEKLHIFVLNSGRHSNRDENIPHGRIDTEQLVWFERKAKEYKKKDGWKLILLHHHLYSYPSPYQFHDVSILEEGSDIVRIAGENGINIVCHGHKHHPNAQNRFQNGWEKPITFICVGSCSVNSIHRGNGEIPNCFHILQLCDGYVASLKNYEYSSKDGWKPFVINRPEAPLDAEMFFSKPFDKSDRIEKFKCIVQNNENPQGVKLPAWGELPIELKSMTYKELNALLRELSIDEFDIFGSYPKEVALLRKNK